MKRSLDPFRAVPLLNLEERAESISCTDSELYIGTTQGNLVQYQLSWGGGAPEAAAATARRFGAVRLSPKRPVEQVHSLPGLVAALADGAVNILPADIQSFAGTVLCREAKLLCPHTGTEDRGQGHPREICVSFRKKLVLYAHNGRTFEQRQEFQSPEPAVAMAWHQSWICVGFRREYTLYSDRNGVPREVYRLDGKVPPQIAVTGNDMLLLVQESKSLRLSLGSQQLSPNPLTWPRKAAKTGASGGFVLGSTGQGQVDVLCVRDYRNCQTLALEGNTVAICSAAGGRVLVAAETSVTCLDLVPFERQLQRLLAQVRVSDALELLNATFSPEDAEREKQLSRFHAHAGWALFRDLQFLPAFQHFLYSSDFRLVKVLTLWRGYLPSKFDPEACTDPGAASDGSPNFAGGVADFIRERLLERHPPDGASDSAVSANVDLANAGVVSFLLRQRAALVSQERLPAEQRAPGMSNAGPLLQAVDTVLLKLLIEIDQDDQRLQELMESGVRCAVEDCEGLLRGKSRIDVLARLWKEQGMHELVLREWSSLLSGIEDDKSSAAQVAASLHITKSQIVSEMCSALKGASSCPGGAELLRQYVPELLKLDPPALLPVFAGPPSPGCPARCPLKADEVLRLLQGHDAVMLGYLEHLVSSKRDAEPQHRTQLALIYLSQAAEEQRAAGAECAGASPARQKLQRFLEETEDLDARDLLQRAEALGLHEERAVLHCREQQHKEALRIVVEDLNDLPRAEVYCRVVMARQQRRQAGAPAGGPPGGGQAAGVSVLGPDPPVWARAVAFGPRRGGEDEEAAPAGDAPGPRPGGTAEAGPRPLMLFLAVLLEASAGAEKQPKDYRKVAAEYKEAALSLLTAYAGHRDLPPSEVVGMLPADWSLESLAGYLTRCARVGLHEQRASMLEKKLSSMAYLKTYGALAHERSRKVTITGDRCCPVCNRRFVDKDSVGKAFVAYPNETCVHLQCKADLSVCPKTGLSFADNLSVYCNALGGMDSSEP